ncbi:MAG: hypothetical protein JSU96_12055 [Acidobacteriota bacterium]|nr:MAG: hypothetical protein JSU96_12055 [Acidobacteriota bacterium]
MRDGESLYVDRPHRLAWQSSVLLFCLSVLDARLSLLLFEEGRLQEANPILFLGLLYGDHVFLAIKFLLTGFSIFVLLLHWNFVIGRGTVRVSWLLWTMIVGYLMIVAYELLLLSH